MQTKSTIFPCYYKDLLMSDIDELLELYLPWDKEVEDLREDIKIEIKDLNGTIHYLNKSTLINEQNNSR